MNTQQGWRAGASSGGGGGSNDKVKVDGGDATADFLKSKIQSDYTISVTFDTSNPSYIQILSANVSRWDDNGVTQNYASGSINTLGGFANVGTTGSQNTAVGVDVFNAGTSLTNSVGLGNNIAKTLVTAQQLTAIGHNALSSLTSAGNEQVAIGSGTLGINTGNTGGAFTGDFNVAVGTDSMAQLNGGYRNTSLGHNSGGVLTTGARNILIGFEVGLSALTNITTGNDNILMGYLTDTDGDENLIIGNNSSSQLGSAIANQNTLVGNFCLVNSSLQVVMGYNARITNGGQDVLIGVNSSVDGSAFPTFPTLSTHVGSAGTFVGFYNQSLGYNQSITGEDCVALGNFNSITGNDNISIGNGLTMRTTQAYAMGVDSSSMVDYSFQVSWNNGVQNFDGIKIVSKASSVISQSVIDVVGGLTIDAPVGTTFNSGNVIIQKGLSTHNQRQTLNAGTPASAPNFTNAQTFNWELETNATINNPVNNRTGTYFITLKQDAVGSRTVTWGANYIWAGGSPPTLTTTPNKYDVIMLNNIQDVAGNTICLASVVGLNY